MLQVIQIASLPFTPKKFKEKKKKLKLNSLPAAIEETSSDLIRQLNVQVARTTATHGIEITRQQTRER